MSSDYMKMGLFFVGGIALGALGTVAVSNGKLNIKPTLTELLSRGMDVKDALMSKVETVKEDVEDMAAQAKNMSEQRKEAAEQA